MWEVFTAAPSGMPGDRVVTIAERSRPITCEKGMRVVERLAADASEAAWESSQWTHCWSKGDSNSPSHPEHQHSEGPPRLVPRTVPGFGVAPP
jgi:hypothetical protein